jgi:hypothetical protein
MVEVQYFANGLRHCGLSRSPMRAIRVRDCSGERAESIEGRRRWIQACWRCRGVQLMEYEFEFRNMDAILG